METKIINKNEYKLMTPCGSPMGDKTLAVATLPHLSFVVSPLEQSSQKTAQLARMDGRAFPLLRSSPTARLARSMVTGYVELL